MELFNKLQNVPILETISFCLGPLRDANIFLLSSIVPTTYVLGWDALGKNYARFLFSLKMKI